MLGDGYHDVPRGKVATVVTFLEMTEPVAPRPVQLPDELSFQRITPVGVAWYRDIFTRVGAQDWLWFSRQVMAEAELRNVLDAPGVEIYSLIRDGRAEALLELKFEADGTCELVFFGVTPAVLGSGAGRYLMNRALDIVWSRPVRRFHLHTCSLDHPAALGFYLRTGFQAVAQKVEVEDDPRLTGHLPDTAGPHVPIIRPE